MRRSACLGLSCLLVATALGAARPVGVPTRAVMVGGNRDMDACGTLMEIRFQTRAPGNFAAVRAAPSINAREKHRLFDGNRVIACESIGEWTGVVYPMPGDGVDEDIGNCGVSSPMAKRKPYNGPCASGWIASRLLRALAG